MWKSEDCDCSDCWFSFGELVCREVFSSGLSENMNIATIAIMTIVVIAVICALFMFL